VSGLTDYPLHVERSRRLFYLAAGSLATSALALAARRPCRRCHL